MDWELVLDDHDHVPILRTVRSDDDEADVEIRVHDGAIEVETASYDTFATAIVPLQLLANLLRLHGAEMPPGEDLRLEDIRPRERRQATGADYIAAALARGWTVVATNEEYRAAIEKAGADPGRAPHLCFRETLTIEAPDGASVTIMAAGIVWP